jgi:tRNA1Val (adenine37-N6)-methyltransferase
MNMAKNNWFQFKQFRINQQQSAMKVGTDGVLLGAWAGILQAKTILDIGAGTGVIALMLAQRSNAQITAIEIEKNAAEEAAENVANAPWSDRITVLNTSLQDFVKTNPGTFDLIVSNPPFFTNSQKSKCDYLAMAKHNHLLPTGELVDCSARLMASGGRVAVILPALSAEDFVKTAENTGLFLYRQTQVSPRSFKRAHRFLMEFTKNKVETISDTLNIHTDDGSDFTEEYKNLTRTFYLSF